MKKIKWIRKKVKNTLIKLIQVLVLHGFKNKCFPGLLNVPENIGFSWIPYFHWWYFHIATTNLICSTNQLTGFNESAVSYIIAILFEMRNEKSKCTWVLCAITLSLVNDFDKANFRWDLLLKNIMY